MGVPENSVSLRVGLCSCRWLFAAMGLTTDVAEFPTTARGTERPPVINCESGFGRIPR